MPERIPQSTTKRVAFKAFLSVDHVTPATGKTIAITISKNGGAFGNPSAGATNATEIASGWYYVDLSTTDTGTVGPVIVLGTVAAVDPAEVFFTVADDATTLAAAVLASVVEGTVTLLKAVRAVLAASIGKLSGAAGTTVTIRDTTDAKDRVVATVDSSGNRSAVTLDLT